MADLDYERIAGILVDCDENKQFKHSLEGRLAAAKMLKGKVNHDVLYVLGRYRCCRGDDVNGHPACTDDPAIIIVLKQVWEQNVREYQTLSPTSCVLRVAEKVLGRRPNIYKQLPQKVMHRISYISEVVNGNNPNVAVLLGALLGANLNPTTLRELLNNFSSRGSSSPLDFDFC